MTTNERWPPDAHYWEVMTQQIDATVEVLANTDPRAESAVAVRLAHARHMLAVHLADEQLDHLIRALLAARRLRRRSE